MKIIVGITGASGSIYAKRLLEFLTGRDFEVHAVFSRTGEQVMRYECDCGRNDFPNVTWHEPDNMFASIASGSRPTDGMVVVPCSVNTLSNIAYGLSGNLLQRAAGVVLKEKRNLIVVPRETPLSTIHLEAMLRLAQAGATLLPASPAFYHRPRTIDDLVAQVVGKMLNLLRIPHDLFPEWEDAPPNR